MAELTVMANEKNLDAVIDFIHEQLNNYDCSQNLQAQMDLIVEEIYVNIAQYAYHPLEGKATIRCTIDGEPLQIILEFLDFGKPYNPLKQEDPDVTLPEDERGIGGLGIYIAKNLADEIYYELQDGRNVLTILKKLKK